jgi:hypothetical protein
MGTVLDSATSETLYASLASPAPVIDDDVWAAMVFAFLAAANHGATTNIDQLASLFVPVYLWRAANFFAITADETNAMVESRLTQIANAFIRAKPQLVSRWAAAA